MKRVYYTEELVESKGDWEHRSLLTRHDILDRDMNN
jgi:hypothetical protein